MPGGYTAGKCSDDVQLEQPVRPLLGLVRSPGTLEVTRRSSAVCPASCWVYPVDRNDPKQSKYSQASLSCHSQKFEVFSLLLLSVLSVEKVFKRLAC